MIQTPFWLIKRTRLLNVVHFLGFANAYSQMNLTEKLVLGKYAKGKKRTTGWHCFIQRMCFYALPFMKD